MAVTLEDLDRRVTALEKAGESEKTIVRAAAEIVAESEKRLTAVVKANETRIVDSEKRVTKVVSDAERHMVDILNERFDAVMAALDRFQNPPK